MVISNSVHHNSSRGHAASAGCPWDVRDVQLAGAVPAHTRSFLWKHHLVRCLAQGDERDGVRDFERAESVAFRMSESSWCGLTRSKEYHSWGKMRNITDVIVVVIKFHPICLQLRNGRKG